jgi:steroid delta-isomerase-like uncharacterized protein
MSPEENKEIIRRFYAECWDTGDLAAVDRFVAPSYHAAAVGQDREDYKRTMAAMRASFPDLHWTLEDLIAEGDKVVNRWTMHGTHRGEWSGIAPTGQVVAMPGITIFRLVNGKIVER